MKRFLFSLALFMSISSSAFAADFVTLFDSKTLDGWELINSQPGVWIVRDGLLVTSGKGRWFPRGLPVAKITKVTRRELGRDQEVEAAPTVNFSRLDSVLILVTPPSDEPSDTPAGNLGTRVSPKGK